MWNWRVVFVAHISCLLIVVYCQLGFCFSIITALFLLFDRPKKKQKQKQNSMNWQLDNKCCKCRQLLVIIDWSFFISKQILQSILSPIYRIRLDSIQFKSLTEFTTAIPNRQNSINNQRISLIYLTIWSIAIILYRQEE